MILYDKLHSAKNIFRNRFYGTQKKYKNETLSDRENNDKFGIKRII